MTTIDRPAPVRRNEEDTLLRQILGVCAWHRQLFVLHVRPARTLHGYRTPVAGNGEGFPDLMILGPARVVYRELKSSTGRLEPEQREWRDRLLAAGLDWALWRPADWESGLIRAELTRLAHERSPYEH